jgi:hypothetical protein
MQQWGRSCRLFLLIRLRSSWYEILLSQGLQHLLVADPPADFLPASPVESRFVAINSGHILSPAFWLAKVKTERHYRAKNPRAVSRELFLRVR